MVWSVRRPVTSFSSSFFKSCSFLVFLGENVTNFSHAVGLELVFAGIIFSFCAH